MVEFCQTTRYPKAIFSACLTVAFLRFGDNKLYLKVNIPHLWGADKWEGKEKAMLTDH